MLLIVKVLTKLARFVLHFQMKQNKTRGGGGGDAKRRLTVNMLWFQAYKAADQTRKFVMRFLMREIINQLSALQRPLEAASDTLDDQARQERSGWFMSCYAAQKSLVLALDFSHRGIAEIGEVSGGGGRARMSLELKVKQGRGLINWRQFLLLFTFCYVKKMFKDNHISKTLAVVIFAVLCARLLCAIFNLNIMKVCLICSEGMQLHRAIFNLNIMKVCLICSEGT